MNSPFMMQTQTADNLLTLQELRQSLSSPIRKAGAQFKGFVIEGLSIVENESSFEPRGKNGNRWIIVSSGGDNQPKQKIKICLTPGVWQNAIDKGYRISGDVAIDVAIDHLWIDPWCRLVITAMAIRVSGQSHVEARKQQIEDYCSENGYFERPKKSLPFFVRNVAIITSQQSTVESDITEQIGLKREFVHSYRFNGTAEDLSAKIHELANMNRYDLVCLYRGGREDEAMLVYSYESVLDEIVQSPIPVVTALGHELDTPPVQRVADKGYDTPSRFALEIKAHNESARNEINSIAWDIRNNFTRITDRKKDIKKNIFIAILVAIIIALIYKFLK